MSDWHKSKIAWAMFDAMRVHPPFPWDETAVTDYNGILTALEAAEPDKDLSSFRVPLGELEPRVEGFTRATRRAPGRTFYSSKLYCDDGRMTRRLEGVASYLAAIAAPASAPTDAPTAPDGCPAPKRAAPGPIKRAASAVGRFLWVQAQAIAPALVNAWLKRKGLE